MHADFSRQVGRLQAHANAVFQLLFLAVGIKAQHQRLPAAARAQPFQDLEGAGLAGAVRAEQTENLARFHLKGDALTASTLS